MGRAVAIRANIVTHKLESFSEDETLFKTQGQPVHLADSQLAFHVMKQCVGISPMAESSMIIRVVVLLQIVIPEEVASDSTDY